MLNEPLNQILGTVTKVAVLRVLAHVHSPMTGRAIERSARVAHAACLRALQELSIAGIVISKQYGKERLYELNRNSILVARGLIPVFDSEKLRRERLFLHIKQWLRNSKVDVLHTSIYGSVARGEDRLGSDLDLLLVVRNGREKERLLESWLGIEPMVNETFSVRVSPYILTLKETEQRHRAKDRLIQAAIREGFTLFGKKLMELFDEKVRR